MREFKIQNLWFDIRDFFIYLEPVFVAIAWFVALVLLCLVIQWHIDRHPSGKMAQFLTKITFWLDAEDPNEDPNEEEDGLD